MSDFNRRVLVIDDEKVVRDSFREILAPHRQDTSALHAAANALFDDEPPSASPRSSATFDFEVQGAKSGHEGLERVKASLEAGAPFALVFLDVRMPGWDGLETAVHIREFDTQAEIVFVTAFTDYGLDEVVARAGGNVGYHCKPFSPEEIRQIATKAIHDWNRTRSLEDLIGLVAGLSSGTAQVEVLLENVLTQVAERVGSRSAAILDRGSRGDVLLCTGQLKDASTKARLFEVLDDDLPAGPPVRREEFLILPMGDYQVAALVADENLQTDRLYLLRLFTENASRALENADLQGKLLASEKLSALGLALSRVLHDLRQPLTVLKGAVRLTEVLQHDPEELKRLNVMMQDSVVDLEEYLEDVLAYTRGEVGESERVDLGALLSEIPPRLELLEPFAEVEVSFEVAEGVYVEGDSQKLRRVVLNLLTNAAEAPAVAGRPRRLSLSLVKAGSDALLRVQDNGPGIPPEIRERLFEPFVTSGKRLGTGLGLAMVHQVLGGAIEVEETSPEGTVFAVRLALVD